MTGKNRCKKCRYDKCLRFGMDPKWVLTQDEKRIRFRNFNKKKSDLEKWKNNSDGSNKAMHIAKKAKNQLKEDFGATDSFERF